MGLIQAIKTATQDVFADTWRDFFVCDELDNDTLMVEGKKRVGGKSSNKKGNDNVISNGSIIAVHEGQCMLIVDQGAVVELCAEAGEYIYDSSSEPSIFYGGLGKSIVDYFKTWGRRVSFGGDTARDQRVYFINIKPITGNKFGTSEPIPFTLIEPTYKIQMEFKLRCNGEYQFQITNPMAFYRFVGNVDEYPKSRITTDLRSPFMDGLGSAISELTMQGISYTALRSHQEELTAGINKSITAYTEEKGIQIAYIFFNSLTLPEDIQKQYDAIQLKKIYSVDPNQLTAEVSLGMVEAAKTAAANEAGAMNGFMGVGMLNGMNQSGMSPMGMVGGMQPNAMMQQNMMQPNPMQQNMQQAAPAPQAPAADSWTCKCGAVCTGNFCMQCGEKKPAPVAAEGWTCQCGAVNKGNFCPNCGSKRPAGAPLYRCDKCGWEPADPKNPPKFCPECGDPFTDGDIQ
ncbi:MAG: SPFH domain-containing protein [Lachnospiraceae bacterium]|nr:SPFH domain-containing protein [Lachnospiraceae bacterium]